MKLFNESNQWYKGNIHMHTTISDGLLGYDESIHVYKELGYDFISVTDHNIYNPDHDEKDFLILSGIEIDFDEKYPNKTYHILGVGMDNNIDLKDCDTPQNAINQIINQQGLAIIAHPVTSLMQYQDSVELEGYTGIEIWNSECEIRNARGVADYYIDMVAISGLTPMIFAVDDTHYYDDEVSCGYIMVNSECLNKEQILKNIRSGNFYCSQGPQIKQITINNGRIIVETSPVKQVSFMSNTLFSEDRVQKANLEAITCCEYVIKPTDLYVRIEGIDENGKKCWSQIIRLNDYA